MNTEKFQSEHQENEATIKLTWTRFIKMVFHIVRQFDNAYYSGFAAQIAYFFFMASFPTIIVLTQVLGIFDVSIDFIVDWINTNVDKHLSSFVVNLFSQTSSVAFSNVLFILLAIWAASGLLFSLSRLASHIISDGRYRFPFLTERLKSVPMALLAIIVIAFTLIAYVYGGILIDSFIQNTSLASMLTFIRIPLLFLAFFVMVFGLYIIIPRVNVPYIAMLPGAIVATLGMGIVTFIYTLYVERTISYDILYGSFANIVAMVLWFYLISWVLCIGMMFNKAWDIYMRRDRLSPNSIKLGLMKKIGINDRNFDKYYTSKPVMVDRTLDTLGNRLSRRFVPGYAEARDTSLDDYDNAPDV